MKDCPLAAAIRHNTLTPSGRTGEEIAYQLLDAMTEIVRARPWLTEGDAA